MSENKKQANDNLIYGLQGLLAGAAGMSAIEVLRMLKGLWEEKENKPARPTMEQIVLESENEDPFSKTAADGDTWAQFVSGPLEAGKQIGKDIWDAARAVSAPAEKGALDLWARNALFVGGLGTGAWGLAELIDQFKKNQAKKDTDRLKRYYYSRLLEYNKDKKTDAVTERTPIMRKESMDKQAAPSFLEALVAALSLGVPLGGIYVAKKYLDETLPGTKQPAAKIVKDPRAQVARVKYQETSEDEDPTIKIFDGIGKAAALSPASERAWETAHLLRMATATKQASATIIPDILKTVAAGKRSGFHKYAMASDLDGFVDYAEKTASTVDKLSPQQEHLAADLVGADPLVRGMTMPIVCAELTEQYPTGVKLAAAMRPQAASACLAVAKAFTLEKEEELFPQAFEKRASEENYKPLTLSQFIEQTEAALARAQ